METKNGLSQEDLLRLASLGEVFGGFAHEIAQPLNAIMIASQVVQLKVERSDLPEEEKKFVVHRLNIVTSQVQKASEIVESLRLFSGASFSGSGETGLKGIFEKVYGLMGQQFISRGIDLKCECDEALPSIRNNPNLLEGVMVQGLAFARRGCSTRRMARPAEYSVQEVLKREVHRTGRRLRCRHPLGFRRSPRGYDCHGCAKPYRPGHGRHCPRFHGGKTRSHRFSFEDYFSLNEPHHSAKGRESRVSRDGFRWSPHLSRANGLAITM